MSDINDRGRGHDPASKRPAPADEARAGREDPQVADVIVDADPDEGGEAIIDRSGALIATHAPDPDH